MSFRFFSRALVLALMLVFSPSAMHALYTMTGTEARKQAEKEAPKKNISKQTTTNPATMMSFTDPRWSANNINEIQHEQYGRVAQSLTPNIAGRYQKKVVGPAQRSSNYWGWLQFITKPLPYLYSLFTLARYMTTPKPSDQLMQSLQQPDTATSSLRFLPLIGNALISPVLLYGSCYLISYQCKNAQLKASNAEHHFKRFIAGQPEIPIKGANGKQQYYGRPLKGYNTNVARDNNALLNRIHPTTPKRTESTDSINSSQPQAKKQLPDAPPPLVQRKLSKLEKSQTQPFSQPIATSSAHSSPVTLADSPTITGHVDNTGNQVKLCNEEFLDFSLLLGRKYTQFFTVKSIDEGHQLYLAINRNNNLLSSTSLPMQWKKPEDDAILREIAGIKHKSIEIFEVPSSVHLRNLTMLPATTQHSYSMNAECNADSDGTLRPIPLYCVEHSFLNKNLCYNAEASWKITETVPKKGVFLSHDDVLLKEQERPRIVTKRKPASKKLFFRTTAPTHNPPHPYNIITRAEEQWKKQQDEWAKNEARLEAERRKLADASTQLYWQEQRNKLETYDPLKAKS